MQYKRQEVVSSKTKYVFHINISKLITGITGINLSADTLSVKCSRYACAHANAKSDILKLNV